MSAAPYFFDQDVERYGPPIAEFASGRDAMIFATIKREAGEDCRVYAGLNALPFAVHTVRRLPREEDKGFRMLLGQS